MPLSHLQLSPRRAVRLRVLALIPVLLVAGGGIAARSQTATLSAQGATDVITRQGTRLVLNGQQYKFAGLNADTWFGCWANEIPTDAQLDQYFGGLNPHSMTRIWPMPGSDLAIMDRIVAAAERHHQYLAATLVNGNPDCDSLGAKDAGFYNGGYRNGYFSHIRDVVPRYRNSPAIGFWELINEPDGHQVKPLFDDASALVKSLDPNHLVGTGAHAAWSFPGEQAYIDAHSSPNIDLISMHEYDGNTGLSGWADAADQASRALNKPWYAGEDGFCCGGGDTGSQAGNAAKLQAEWGAYLGSANCAGMMYWDFKLNHPDAAAVSFGSPMWAAATGFRNPYSGGTATPAPSVTPIHTPAPTPRPTPGPTPHPGGLTSVDDTRIGTGLDQWQYAGTWSADTVGAGKYNHTDHYSGTAGSTATLTFVGSRVTLVGAKAPWHGIAAVSVDGGAETSVSYYGSSRTDQAALYTSAPLRPGRHTLRVRVTGTATAESGGRVVTIDRADVSPAPATVTRQIDDVTIGSGDGHITYTGRWAADAGSPAKFAGTDHYAASAGASAQLRFTGTSVRLYGARAPWHGRAQVSIDGRAPLLVDYYAAARVDQALVFTSPPLAQGQHTLVLTVLGTHTEASAGNVVTVDRFDVVGVA